MDDLEETLSSESPLVRQAPSLPNLPAWTTACLGELSLRARLAEQEMKVAPWMRDARGGVAPGVLAVLSDSVLSWAAMSTVPVERGMATSHIHLELLQAIPRDTQTFRCRGQQCAVDECSALAEGEISDASGKLLAKSTVGVVLLEERPQHEGQSATGRPASPLLDAQVEASPVLAELGTEVQSAEPSFARLRVSASPRFANRSGGVQGGFGVLMGERTLDLALRTALREERSMRPVELRAAFLRPIVADGTRVECRASVLHLGRRLAATRGEVRDQRGRPAVLVDATYIAV